MNTETLTFILGISGVIITILFTIVTFFVRQLTIDLRKAVEDNNRNGSRIGLVEQQLNSDLRRVEQLTQLELRNLSENVSRLSLSVETLVKHQLKQAEGQ